MSKHHRFCRAKPATIPKEREAFETKAMVISMKHGFIKVAAASPLIRVADCEYNLKSIISLTKYADSKQIKLIVFPELSLTAYTCGDLFLNKALISSAHDSLLKYIDATAQLDTVSVVGLPVRHNGKLYDCAAVCHRGQLLGIVPKTNLTASEMRYFSALKNNSGRAAFCDILGTTVPFGTDLRFDCKSLSEFKLTVELGNDLFAPSSPACETAASGATVIACPAASCEIVGKEVYRQTVISARSATTASGYIYANAGYGESSTDHVFASHCIISESGNILAQALPFDISADTADSDRLVISELDLDMLDREKAKLCHTESRDVFSISFDVDFSDTELTRKYSPMPFVPSDRNELESRAETILKIQSNGLRRRMEAAFAQKCIIGISGGLDSTLALLVAARACDDARRPRTDIIGITMPCFGTTNRTKSNAELLCKELGIEFRTVMIGESVKSHFADIGHDINNRNVVYENGQARERTQVLMDIANAENGLVIGTGDMSELALGWATYNGDHMSMYGVNASIPKTLVRALVKHCADIASSKAQNELERVLIDILDTPVSPELLPADGEKIKQKTEDLVGPYEIHDFYLYYMLRFGFSPEKLYRLAIHTLGDLYSKETLLKWLEVFIKRFFSQQYKRSCLPDGPAVGSVGLSPRGGLSMPSDASASIWKAEIESLKSKN